MESAPSSLHLRHRQAHQSDDDTPFATEDWTRIYLPEEILEHIFSYFPQAGLGKKTTRGKRLNSKSLLSLCRVSKDFQRIVQPKLYRNVCIRNYDSLCSFISTLHRRRDLIPVVRNIRALHTEQMRASTSSTPYIEAGTYASPLQDVFDVWFTTYNIPISTKKSIEENMRCGTIGSLLLLGLCTKLETVQLGVIGILERHMLEELVVGVRSGIYPLITSPVRQEPASPSAIECSRLTELREIKHIPLALRQPFSPIRFNVLWTRTYADCADSASGGYGAHLSPLTARDATQMPVSSDASHPFTSPDACEIAVDYPI